MKMNTAHNKVELGGAKLILFFSSPRKKRRRNPNSHCSTFASHTSQRSKTKLAKEPQFCLHTRAKLLLLSF